MCGIAGAVGVRGVRADRVIELLRHRGPDHQGVWRGVCGGQDVELIHTRLKVLDLSEAANQPFVGRGANQEPILVYNGEIYNYLELRREILGNVPLSSNGDTAVLYEGLRRYGRWFLERLRGDFAFGFLERRDGVLLLARDPLGVRPLYYRRIGKGLVFASEIAPLLEIGDRPRLSEEGIALFFSLGYCPGDMTPFEGVRKLRAGHYLEVRLADMKVTTGRYWSWPAEREGGGGYAEAVERVREVVEKAVKRQLVADVPVAVLLSGGVDSTIISSAARSSGREVMVVTAVRGEGEDASEGTVEDARYARAVAERWGLRLTEVRTERTLLNGQSLRDVVRWMPDLVADPAVLSAEALTRAVARHARVALTGMGADELFMGYAGPWLECIHHVAWPVLRLVPERALRDVAEGIWVGRGRFRSARRIARKFLWHAKAGRWRPAYYAVMHDIGSAGRLLRISQDPVFEFLGKYFPPGREARREWSLRSITRFETECFLEKNLRYMDVAAMRNSVEGRVPFVDVDVVECALRLRWDEKMRCLPYEPKRILKDAFRSVLPPEVRRRRKAGFGLAIRRLFADPRTMQMMDKEVLIASGIVDADAAERIWREHIAGKADHATQILALLLFQEWVRTYA